MYIIQAKYLHALRKRKWETKCEDIFENILSGIFARILIRSVVDISMFRIGK